MKIGQYEQMMSYLTRPGFDGGGSTNKPTLEDLKKSGQVKTATDYKPKNPKIIQIIRDFEARNPRTNKSNGGSLVPEPKPTDPTQKLDLYLQGYLGTSNKQFYIDKLQETIDQYQESGIMEQKDAVEYLQKKKQEYLDLSKQGEPLPSRGNFAIGGGAIEGEDLGTREGFAGPQLVKTGDKKGQYKVRYRDSKFGKRDKGTGYKEGNEFFKTKKEADAFYKKLKSETAAKKAAGLDIKKYSFKKSSTTNK